MLNVFDKIKNSESPLIMGIVNVTPDSFSDGGKFIRTDDALNHALKLLEEGADILDIGGESTRPGADEVSVEEELNRVIPVIKKISEQKPSTIISVDTTKSEVARQALINGASIVNDISAGTFDENIFTVVKEFDATIVLMHIKGTPKNMQENPFYENVVTEVKEFLEKRVKTAKSFGINKIIIDPGIGFGKRVFENYELLKSIDIFNRLNYPVLIGLSKKSLLGKALNLEIQERENATTVAETIAVLNGAKIIRTHNVKNAVEIKKIVTFINNPKQLSYV